MEEKGIRTMYYTRNNLEILEDEQKLNEILVTEVTRKYHDSPEVIQANWSTTTSRNSTHSTRLKTSARGE